MDDTNKTGSVIVPENTFCVAYRVGDIVKGGAIALDSTDLVKQIRDMAEQAIYEIQNG